MIVKRLYQIQSFVYEPCAVLAESSIKCVSELEMEPYVENALGECCDRRTLSSKELERPIPTTSAREVTKIAI